MALDFPSLPYDGQIFTDPTTGSKYIYEAATTKWKSIQHTGVITAYGFDKANAAFLVANAAYDAANNVGPQIAPAFDTANAAFASANNVAPQVTPAFLTANLAFSKANTANVLAYDTGIGANSYTNTVGTAGNNYINSVGTAGNNYTDYVGTSANSFTNATYVKLTAPNQTITGDLAITGNLSLLGNVTTLLSNNLIVNDSLIYLAANNDQSDIIDIGFVGHYGNATANLHTGLYRDHATKQYFLFNDLAGPEPETINDIVPYANGMINAVLNADIATSNLILGGANAINWITSLYNSSNSDYVVSNAAFGKANTALQNTTGTFSGTLTVTGNIIMGGGTSVGYLTIPQNSQTSAYVLVASDTGKHISITTGGVTVNASVFSVGDTVLIYNNSGSNQTITQGTNVTLRLSGTATTGNRTLAQYGTATLLCVTGGANPVFVISGSGLS